LHVSRKYIGIKEARPALGDLVTAALQGADIVITRNGKPAVRLVAITEDTMTTTLTLVIPNVEAVDIADTYTRGWIVPAGTPVNEDIELKAVDHIDIPASEDEATWWQGLRDAAAYDGWAVEDPIAQDGTTVTAVVVKVDA
jgi:prevent-host-death family protein